MSSTKDSISLVGPDPRPAWGANLHEAQLADVFGMTRQQTVDGLQALGDALGVIDAINAQQHALVGQRELMLQPSHTYAGVLRHRLLAQPIDVEADRKRSDQCHVISARDRRVVVVDTRLDARRHALEEILAMIPDVKAEEIIAQQARQNLFAPRTDAEGFPVRPWNVPELSE
jgi:hypothetical protein